MQSYLKSISTIENDSAKKRSLSGERQSQTNVYVYHNTFTAPNAQVGCLNGVSSL